MGHTFTYYAFLIKLTKSQEKSNIKLSAGRDKKASFDNHSPIG